MEDYILGIDFGTTYSCVSVWKDGGLVIIPNESGERTTPSVVIFEGPDKAFVGEETLYHLPKDNSVKIYEIKRLLGKKYNQIKDILDYFPFKIIEEENGDKPMIEMTFGENNTLKVYPEQIAKLIFEKLIKNAETFLNQQIREVLITVPADFNETQKNAVRFSAEQIKGLRVLQVINEPSAAVLAYGFPNFLIQKKFLHFNKYFTLVKQKNIFHPMEEMSINSSSKNELTYYNTDQESIQLIGNNIDLSREEVSNSDNNSTGNLQNWSLLSQNKDLTKIIVFDLGGGTYDVSLIYVDKDKLFENMGYSGDQRLGGSDFDKKLMDYALKKFCTINNYDENEIRANYKCIQRLKRACEETKKFLSIETKDKIILEDFYNSKPLCCEITREKFEELCEDLFKRLIKPLDSILEKKNLNNTDIDEIILVGGSSKIPKVKEIISQKFKDVPINDQISPDEVVAYGAIIYAESLRRLDDNLWNNFNYIDKTGHSIGIEIEDGSMQVLIPKGTIYPKSSFSFFETVYDSQYTFDIKVYEGEEKIADKNELIGEFELRGFPQRPKGEIILKVTISIDQNQTIIVTGFVQEGNVKQQLIINRKNQYPDFKKSHRLDLKQNELNNEEKEIQSIIYEYSKNFCLQKTDQAKYNLIKNYNLAVIKYLYFFEKNYQDTSSEKYLYLLEKLFKSYIYYFNTSLKNLVDIEQKGEIKNNVKIFLEKINIGAPFRIKQLLNFFKNVKDDDFSERLDIFVFAMDLLYKKAIENYNKKEKSFIKYAKTLFEECLIISKTFIEENDTSKMDFNTLARFKQIKEDCEKKIKYISALSLTYIENLQKKGELFDNKNNLGKDDLNLLLYDLELGLKKLNSIENLNKNEEALEIKSFYQANIVKIEFIKNDKNMDLERLEKYAMESITIASQLKNNCKDKPWFKEINQLKEKIKNKIKNDQPAPPIENIDDIEEKFSNLLHNGVENLLRYILEKYPYNGYKFSEESIEEFRKNKKKFLINLRRRYGLEASKVIHLENGVFDNITLLNNKIVEYINKMIDKLDNEEINIII